MRGKRVTKVRGKRRNFLFCTTCSYAPPPANPRPRSVPHGIIIIPLFASRFRFKRSSHKTEGSETIYPRITYDADITIIVGKCESAHPSSVINTQTSADRLPSRHCSIQFALLRDVCRERFPPIPCPRARKEIEKRRDSRSSEHGSKDLSPDCCWGNFRLFCLCHRRNVGHKVDVLQSGDPGPVDNLVAKIQGDVDCDVDV